MEDIQHNLIHLLSKYWNNDDDDFICKGPLLSCLGCCCTTFWNIKQLATSLNSCKAKSMASFRREWFFVSRQTDSACLLQNQDFHSISQQFHPQADSKLKCMPITEYVKYPMPFGILKRATAVFIQKEELCTCYICNVYLGFNVSSEWSNVYLCFRQQGESPDLSCLSGSL